ncbi:MAG: class I SAM-dependent methyltransferase [bacterium]|nr:class I SAM-dependent methyltransferase [bacterium]
MRPPDTNKVGMREIGVVNYDEYWAGPMDIYFNHPTNRHRRRFLRNAVRAYAVPKPRFVFDYGCGVGINLVHLRDWLALEDDRLGGYDVSESAIAEVRKSIESPYLYAGSPPPLERPIDLAVCTEVIEHTTEYMAILTWLYDHLAPGGRLILTTPGIPMDPPDVFYGHVQHFRLAELVERLKGIGFAIDQARNWGFPLFSLQKWITRRFFDKVRANYMEGPLTPKMKFVFNAAYIAYFVHDLIPMGPQIYIRAAKPGRLGTRPSRETNPA